MVVVAVTGLPHRMHQGSERLILALEAGDEPGETPERSIGLAIGGAFREIDGFLFTRGLPALELHVGEPRYGPAIRNVAEAAVAENRRFKRQLRREARSHLFLGAHLAGFVIDDGVLAVDQPTDTASTAPEAKAALPDRNRDLAANFGMALRKSSPPHRLPADEPGRGAPEPRPPERARFRKILERPESFAPDPQQLLERIE